MYGDVHREDFCGMEGRDGGPMQFLYVYNAVRCDLTGVVANIPCPAQCDEHASYVTADYFGVVRSRLQEALGEAVCLLPLVRAAGDLSPHDMVDRMPGIERCEGRRGVRAAARTGKTGFHTEKRNACAPREQRHSLPHLERYGGRIPRIQGVFTGAQREQYAGHAVFYPLYPRETV